MLWLWLHTLTVADDPSFLYLLKMPLTHLRFNLTPKTVRQDGRKLYKKLFSADVNCCSHP